MRASVEERGDGAHPRHTAHHLRSSATTRWVVEVAATQRHGDLTVFPEDEVSVGESSQTCCGGFEPSDQLGDLGDGRSDPGGRNVP